MSDDPAVLQLDEPASGPATVCGVFVETDPKTGLALRVEPIRVGGRLKPTMPEL